MIEKETYFLFCAEKDKLLQETRRVSFNQVIDRIKAGAILAVTRNKKEYPGQLIAIIELNGYAYQVPLRVRKGYIQLITAFPSRKHTKKLIKQ